MATCRHLLIGGDVNGGRVFNQFPASLLEGNGQDAGQGRLIPSHPWESFQIPLATWMGIDQSQHADVFPNVVNFNESYILPVDDLFISS